MERMSNTINARVEELREHLKISYKEVELLETKLARVEKDNKKLEEENKALRENVNHRAGRCADLSEENKTLKDNVEFLHQCLDDRDKSIQYAEEENKKLKNKRIFSSDEYDLITLTSTTPQWELRRK